MKSRVVFLILVLFSGLLLIVARLATIQIFPHQALSRYHDRLYSTVLSIPPHRGRILAAGGEELATTMTSYSLFADSERIEFPKELAKELSNFLGLQYKDTLKKLKSGKRFVWLKRFLNISQMTEIKAWGEKGLGFIEEGKRAYPDQNLLSQILGQVSSEGEGLEGLEKQYDDVLKGEKHSLAARRDARGRPILLDGQILSLSSDGETIQTTIDKSLQYELQRQLTQVVQEQRATGAQGVILNPKTGEVLAMSSVEANGKINRNRPVTDLFEPGSTFKVVTIASALKTGRIKPNTKYFCEFGKYQIGKRTIRDSDEKHAYGWLTMAEILRVSSNIGVTKIAFDVGQETFKKTLTEMGFSKRSGIDFPGEVSGLLKKGIWPTHLFSNISFGHGIGVTALQLANSYSAIANGGKLMRPYLVKQVLDSNGKVLESKTPEIVSQPLNKEEASLLRLMLSGVTQEGGTGVLAQINGYPVAGKTGTAQVVGPEGGYEKGAYISSFVGFLPANDPMFTILISVERPQKEYYGAQVAAPVFNKIASFALRRSGLLPVEVRPQAILNEPEESAAKTANLNDPEKMPSLKGMTLREVMNQFSGKNLSDVKLIGTGSAYDQSPAPGKAIKPTERVMVFFR